MLRLVESLGATVLNSLAETKGVIQLFLKTLYWIFVGPFKKRAISLEHVASQAVFGGVNSILIVFFVCFAMGMVLAMQSAYQLESFGALNMVAALVSVSMAREIGPVLGSLVIAGRVGAAITAEISTMKVTEQVEALETLALDPVRYLVAPRFLSLLVMLPCLIMIGDIAGILGGYAVGTMALGIRSGLYLELSFDALMAKDIFSGLFKSAIFSMIITLISCYQGLNTRGGAEGVGRATTVAVVLSFIFIILADAVLTFLFYFTGS